MDQAPHYHRVLSAAIAQIEHDSFQARGAVYDRMWQTILKQLRAGNRSETDIARERASFLGAVQRIEFGDREPASAPQETPPSASATDRSRKARRPMFWPITMRMASACVVLLLVGLAYALVIVRADPAAALASAKEASWESSIIRAVLSIKHLIERGSLVPVPEQRAVLYAESKADTAGIPYAGRATWQINPDADSAPALLVDVEIPEKDLALRISMRPEPDPRSIISHYVELRFSRMNGAPTDAVESVVGILMKFDERSRGLELAGQITRVHTDVFLMGFSGIEADARRNLALLRDRPWLDIPIVFKDGSRSILAIEKGETGQNAVNALLAVRR